MIRTVAVFVLYTVIGGIAYCQEKTKTEIDEYSKYALLQEGNAERGRLLFDSPRVSCSKCHSLEGTRSKAGPDLFAVGEKFGRREIVEAVLLPSARIAEGYETTMVLVDDGRVLAGVIKRSTEQSIELLCSNGDLVEVSANSIEARRSSATSLMPQGIHELLSKAEFNDLIAFLVSLKQTDSAARVLHGMPDRIVELSRPVELQPIIDETLKLDRPVWLGSFPGTTDALWVIEHQLRRVWILQKGDSRNNTSQDNTPHKGSSVKQRKELFLDLGPGAPNEGRLAAIVAHPNFQTNRKYYLFDRVTNEGKMYSTIVERVASSDGRRDSGLQPRMLLKVPQSTGAHFGGWMEFGPDGFLYISFGDSGPQEDPNGNAQNRQLMLGKIVRIDVEHTQGAKPYSIPKDNPFLGDATTLPEIWALGFRAPWRLTFDKVTGDLWVGDVGQDRYEEVAIVRRGENHGWNVFEGFEAFSNRFRRTNEVYTPPIFAYTRRYGPSITGGYVYRADASSTFYGKYIFGDFESRRIFALTQQDRVLTEIRQIGISPQRIVSFGQDLEGEIYVVGYEGLLFKIDFSNAHFE